ncbi:MAG TPA: c-type cytochrome [Longimicrobiales bacterium]|nr:c-type cytochrome [Longimicrobiales bacterium]
MKWVVALLKPDRFRTALSYVFFLALPSGIPGSAVTGTDLYQTRCAACHGERGDGQGYAAEALKVMKPADFRRSPARTAPPPRSRAGPSGR